MLSYFIRGVPRPKGSKRAFYSKHTKRAQVAEDNAKARPWQQAVRADSVAELGDRPPLEGPLRVTLGFVLPRPATTPKVRKGRPAAKPDSDKLARTVLDGLTNAGVYRDDGQVCELVVSKRYVAGGDRPGVQVIVSPLPCDHVGGRMRDGRCRDCGEAM